MPPFKKPLKEPPHLFLFATFDGEAGRPSYAVEIRSCGRSLQFDQRYASEGRINSIIDAFQCVEPTVCGCQRWRNHRPLWQSESRPLGVAP